MIKLIVDGATYPKNPGYMRIGVLVLDEEDKVLQYISRDLRQYNTNMAAEYEAIHAGLDYALSNGHQEVRLYSDCQTVLCQLAPKNEAYKVRAKNLIPINRSIKRILPHFKNYELVWHDRETDYARKADDLSKGKITVTKGEHFLSHNA